MSTADQLKKLEKLLREGLITREQFDMERDALLSGGRSSRPTGHSRSIGRYQNTKEPVHSGTVVVYKDHSAEWSRDDPYLGPDVSLLKPWKLAIWIALPCSLFVCAFGVYQFTTGEFVRSAGPQIPVFWAVFFQRLSILSIVGAIIALIIRSSDNRKGTLLSVFYSLPIWRGTFDIDNLDARVSRRIISVRLSIWGTILAIFSSVPWVLSAFHWSPS